MINCYKTKAVKALSIYKLKAGRLFAKEKMLKVCRVILGALHFKSAFCLYNKSLIIAIA